MLNGSVSEALDFLSYDNPNKRRFDPRKIRFYYDLIKDEAKSQELGRPVHKEVEFLEVNFDGEITPKQVTNREREEYKELYLAFLERHKEPLEGTFLKRWIEIDAASAKNLIEMGYKTVEQLVTIPEAQKARLGPDAIWISKAEDFLQRTKGDAKVSSLQQSNKKLAARVKALEAEIEVLSRRYEAVSGERFGSA